MRRQRAFKFACCALLLATCAASAAQVTNYETPGNLQSLAPIGCVDIPALDARKNTPADIYPAVSKCALAGNYEFAAKLSGIAGVYGVFDMQRVADTTAQQAVSVLRDSAYDPLTPAQVAGIQSAVRGFLEDGSAKQKEFCAEVIKLGQPAYFPTYMVQHGMQAFTSNDKAHALKPDFDADKAWTNSLGYVHCSVAPSNAPAAKKDSAKPR